MTISRHGLSVNVVKYIHGEYFFMFIFSALSFFHFSLLHVMTDCFLSLSSLKILFQIKNGLCQEKKKIISETFQM